MNDDVLFIDATKNEVDALFTVGTFYRSNKPVEGGNFLLSANEIQ